MLHRNFKIVKCKTSLKLALSRLKLLKNRKNVQVRQMRRECAQLLESGKEQTARILVEHVIREEKMRSAYDLLEIYCELIVARIQIIESQKNCPIDLKEPITSVIFASPRCSNVIELQDVIKHFAAKYGNEFVLAAVELRPESGVGQMMVELLYAKTPHGHEKIRILKEIAEEHAIKWDSRPLEQIELKPPEDLLNGPNTLEKVEIIQTEHHHVQTAPAPSTFQSPQIFAGIELHQKTSFKRPYTAEEVVSSPSMKNQNLVFEDAVAAAKAAAESAQIACRAAREAAELARQASLSMQSSTESQNSPRLSALRNEEQRREGGKEFSNTKNPGNHSFGVQDENGNYVAGQDKFTRPNRSDSLRSKTSADEKYHKGDHPMKEEKNTLYSKQQSRLAEERIGKPSNINNYGDDNPNISFGPYEIHTGGRQSNLHGSDFHVELASSPSIDKGNVSDKASLDFDVDNNKPSSPSPQQDKHLPVTFDDSNGPSSDTEDEAGGFNPQPSTNVHIQDPQPVLNKEIGPKKKVNSSFDDSESLNEFGAWYDKEMNLFDEAAESRNTIKEPTFSHEDYPSLDFGNLRGGFKHQKPKPLPYTKNQSNLQVKPNQSHFRSNHGESEEDQSSQVSTKVDRVGTVLSRRTKPTPNSKTTEPTPTKPMMLKQRTEADPSEEESLDKTSSRTSYDPKPSSQTMSEEGSEKTEPNGPKPEGQKPGSFRQRTEGDPLRQVTCKEEEAPSKSESPKKKEKASSGEEGPKKASHVHPKLPEYDIVADRLQALRVNRG